METFLSSLTLWEIEHDLACSTRVDQKVPQREFSGELIQRFPVILRCGPFLFVTGSSFGWNLPSPSS